MPEDVYDSTDPTLCERRRLENAKLAAEIATLNRPFWQDAAYVQVFLPTALAAIALLGGILSGYFDATRQRLAAEKIALAADITKLTADNAELDKKRKELEARIDNLRSVGKTVIDDLHGEIAKLQDLAYAKDQYLSELLEKIPRDVPNRLALDESARRVSEELDAIKATLQKSIAKLDSIKAFEVPH